MSKGTGFDYSDREFIKLNRKILNWQWYSDPCTRDVFIHCLLKANWKPGKWHGYQYQRGQFITSLPNLSSELGLSVRSVRTALDHLKSTGELTDWHDSKIRMITVVNYERYQSSDSLNGRRPTGKRQATDRQATGDRQQYKNNKNIKNIKEEKKAAEPRELFPSGIENQEDLESLKAKLRE
jgi:hypothetical protein